MRVIAGRDGVGGGIGGWMRRYLGRGKRQSEGGPSSALYRDAAMGPFGLYGGEDESDDSYADYFVKSVPVYAAIKLRADAVARPGLKVYRVSDGEWAVAQGVGRTRASGAGVAGQGEPALDGRRSLAGDRDVPESLGRGILGC